MTQLIWKTRYWTMRELNPGQYEDDDPEGDIAWSFEVYGFSGLEKIVTIDVMSGEGGIKWVQIKSRMIRKTAWYRMGKEELGNFKPVPLTVPQAMEEAQHRWHQWLLRCGLPIEQETDA